MRTSTLHPVGFALSLAFWAAGCGGDDGGPNVACTLTTTYAIGATVNGELTTSDCLFEGTFIDQYRLEASGQVSVRFTLSSDAFDALLWVFATGSPGGRTLAINDDSAAGNLNSSLHILMAPDSYVVGANSLLRDETGSYTLTSTVIPANNTGCAEVWVTPAVTTSQALATTDCAATGLVYSDEFLIVLLFGHTLTVTMTSPAVSPHLQLRNSNGTLVAESATGTEATIVYTASSNDAFTIVATSDAAEEVGAYTLTVEVGI